jgi:beta-lactamase regulating signal transducer with metallopeptidase domain
MNILDALTPVANPLVASLLNTLWQSAGLVLVVWTCLRLLKRLNATSRYLLWWGTLLGIVLLTGIRLATAMPQPGRTTHVAQLAEPAPFYRPWSKPLSQPLSNLEAHSPNARSSDHERATRPPAFELEPVPTSSAYHSVAIAGRWPAILLVSWLSLAVLLLSRLLYSLLHLVRLKRHARPADAASQELLNSLLARHNITRPITLAVSREIATPIAIGLGKPIILVPAGLDEQLLPDEIEQVLLHELAHLSRWDDWTNLAQQLILAVFCLHPVVHWLGTRLRLERELASDDWVVCAHQEPKAFAQCLVKLAELVKRQPHTDLATGILSQRSQLRRRIEALLAPNRTTSVRVTKAGCASLCALLGAVWFAINQLPPVAVAQEAAVESAKTDDVPGAGKPTPQNTPDQSGPTDSGRGAHNDPAIRELQRTLDLAKVELAELKTQYADLHPQVVRQQARIDALQAILQERTEQLAKDQRRQLSRSQFEEYSGKRELTTDVIQLHSASAAEVLRILQPILPARCNLGVDERRNAVVLTAPQPRFQTLATMIRRVDSAVQQRGTSTANHNSNPPAATRDEKELADLQRQLADSEDVGKRADLLISSLPRDEQEQRARDELRAQVYGSLLEMIKHETNADLRARALATLPRSEVDRNLQLLTDLVLKDSDERVRRQALVTLGSQHSLATTEVVLNLYDQLNGAEPDLKRMIIGSLGIFPAQSADRMAVASKAVARLKRIAKEESDPQLRLDAIQQLGRLAQQLNGGA